ncbi:tRNA-dihydrouridine(20/20a) synthase [Buchnera aphidicola (Cinara kochiana kochiana)]|uniref:tRNA-dihydrouridine synthase n=1 Tax=Buchnera aphidicola (Cinara kochiana kochiana) TaxID=2518976 RepID=A0A451D6C6_9GAMM|nr:tRNA dihydrouridine(20/20a) synthase DusA [Buchnera aphidicola]VFP81264.1 tRNA-dihydrouridine(20/20a) synthase [Buchnera aphidicola (Cinara kochiana kochiana)]
MQKKYSNKFSVAPMLKYTDRHCLFFYRQLTKHTLLYTEMITTHEMLFNKKIFKKKQIKNINPLAIQLAGNNPIHFQECAKIAHLLGFSEINLNIGCPSQHAQNGNFGIFLMYKPKLVYQLIKSIYFTVSIPISVKIRIGTHKDSQYKFLKKFIQQVSKNKYCNKFIIHARIADLRITSPKKNRNIPELNYQYVYQIKKDFPNLIIILNGGIKSIQEIQQHLKHVDGIMIGREIYKNPFLLRQIDEKIFFKQKNIKIKQFFKKMSAYITKEQKKGTKIIHIIKHMLNIFYNQPYSKKWKLHIIQYIHHKKNIHHLFHSIYKIFNQELKIK